MNEVTQRRPRVGDGRFYLGEWLIDPAENVMVSTKRKVVWLTPQERDLLVLLADQPRTQIPRNVLLSRVFAGQEDPERAYAQAVFNLHRTFDGLDSTYTAAGHIQELPYLHMFDNGDMALIQQPMLVESHPLVRYIELQKERQQAVQAAEDKGKGGFLGGCIQFIFWALVALGPILMENC